MNRRAMGSLSRFLAAPFAVFSLPVYAATVENPSNVTVCQLLSDPKAWNQKLVEIAGLASHGFEDSGFSDPACHSRYGSPWMEYGGSKTTRTKSTLSNFGGLRSKPIVVEKIPVPLVEDSPFHRFDDLLHEGDGNLVHATVIARFFAGTEEKLNDGSSRWAGYGHMGCCSLLVIQQVVSVDERRSKDQDYTGEPAQPEASCIQGLTPLDNEQAEIASQRAADRGERSFAFDNPDRVVREEVASQAHLEDDSGMELKHISSEPGRKVYRASIKGKKHAYTVTLSRPYWLSFFAKDPDRVAWTVLGTFVTCDDVR